MNEPVPGAAPHLVLATIDEEARPLSLRVLGAYAEAQGIRTTLLVLLQQLGRVGLPVDFSRAEVRQVAAFLRRENVTHLGFYLMTASLKPYTRLVTALRAAGFRGLIMAGGVHVSLCPAESLVPGADFAVQGPGELPLRMIIGGADPATIPGLVWRRNEEIVVNAVAAEQKLDLADLPLPMFRFDRDKILIKGRLRPFTWRLHEQHAGWHGRYYDLVTSRGCVYRCAYCCNVYGAPVQRASVDRVIAELVAMRRAAPGIRGVNIQDDSFYSGSEEWLREFCQRMKTEVGLPFIIRMIPRFVTPARLEMFKAAGLQYVTMGLQGSTRVNREVFNRKEDSRSFLKAAQAVLAAKLWLSIDLIVHNPYETEADLREVALTLNQLPRPHWWIVALALTPFPNTPLYARCVKDRMLDRFATDAYDSMLIPSRPGGYQTPTFWLQLIRIVLPRVSPEMGAKLIALGPQDPRAAQMVNRLAKSIEATRKATGWLRDNVPTGYALMYRLLRRFSRRAGLPGDMGTVG